MMSAGDIFITGLLIFIFSSGDWPWIGVALMVIGALK